MIARMMRFYQLSDEQIFEMPVSRFFMLQRKIRQIQAEESLRMVVGHHHGKPQEYSKELVAEMKDDGTRKKGKARGKDPHQAALLVAQMGTMEEEKGFVEKERARQREVAKRLTSERKAWLEAQKQASSDNQTP